MKNFACSELDRSQTNSSSESMSNKNLAARSSRSVSPSCVFRYQLMNFGKHSVSPYGRAPAHTQTQTGASVLRDFWQICCAAVTTPCGHFFRNPILVTTSANCVISVQLFWVLIVAQTCHPKLFRHLHTHTSLPRLGQILSLTVNLQGRIFRFFL